MKRGVIIALLSAHLLVICTGTRVFDFSLLPDSLQKACIYYLSLTGGHPYSFFSPDIPAQYVVTCTISDNTGHIIHLSLDSSTNTAQLRTVASVQLLSDNGDYETLADIAARYSHQLYPSGRKVTVVIGKYLPPAMGEVHLHRMDETQELYKNEYSFE